MQKMLDLNKEFNQNLLRFGAGAHRLILAFLFIAIRTPSLSRGTPRRSWTPVWPRREREALTIQLAYRLSDECRKNSAQDAGEEIQLETNLVLSF